MKSTQLEYLVLVHLIDKKYSDLLVVFCLSSNILICSCSFKELIIPVLFKDKTVSFFFKGISKS